jgi:hypothetical protein
MALVATGLIRAFAGRGINRLKTSGKEKSGNQHERKQYCIAKIGHGLSDYCR